jgi:hypothetical protein
MSEFAEKIPSVQTQALNISGTPDTLMPEAPTQEQPGSERRRLTIEAAQIADIKDKNIQEVAMKAFAQELYQVPDWKNILKSAKLLEGSIKLPVDSCGTPLSNNKDENIAKSVVQVTKIQDDKVHEAVGDFMLDVLVINHLLGLKDPALQEATTKFEDRVMELGKCNTVDEQAK